MLARCWNSRLLNGRIVHDAGRLLLVVLLGFWLLLQAIAFWGLGGHVCVRHYGLDFAWGLWMAWEQEKLSC